MSGVCNDRRESIQCTRREHVVCVYDPSAVSVAGVLHILSSLLGPSRYDRLGDFSYHLATPTSSAPPITNFTGLRPPNRVSSVQMVCATWAVPKRSLAQPVDTRMWGGLRLPRVLNRSYSINDIIDSVE